MCTNKLTYALILNQDLHLLVEMIRANALYIRKSWTDS